MCGQVDQNFTQFEICLVCVWAQGTEGRYGRSKGHHDAVRSGFNGCGNSFRRNASWRGIEDGRPLSALRSSCPELRRDQQTISCGMGGRKYSVEIL